MTTPQRAAAPLSLSEAIAAKRAEKVQAIESATPSLAGLFRRVFSPGEASPRQAIKAHCLECVGYLRVEVTACTSYACPLYDFRPYRQGEQEGEEA